MNYRDLETGEVIQPGDEYHITGGEWMRTMHPGGAVPRNRKYRRPVQEPTKTSDLPLPFLTMRRDSDTAVEIGAWLIVALILAGAGYVIYRATVGDAKPSLPVVSTPNQVTHVS